MIWQYRLSRCFTITSLYFFGLSAKKFCAIIEIIWKTDVMPKCEAQKMSCLEDCFVKFAKTLILV